ncbi:MAG: sodium-dependent transporter [Erysipelotrichaceae bacterium]|nr:sodium-dependent transporter [Erysipelotrichaceae bacterium]
MKHREKLTSRLGFLLISAGCAVGLGNVWRFPYITGQYGGAAFVLVYLFFLVILGLPIMTMEFAVGRGSQKSSSLSFDTLEPKGTKWHFIKYLSIMGNYVLMMFYTTVGGWMLNYFIKMATGQLAGLSATETAAVFDSMLASPFENVFFMMLVTILGFFICSKGLQNGVEKVSKWMMSSLFIIMIALVVRSFTLPDAIEGLKFFLIPDFHRMMDAGIFEVVFAAMSQAFFTLSIGIGSLAIFGSYLSKERRLFGESINITILDTAVALLSGLIIFPACFAFGIDVSSGPGLIFVTLPNVFTAMPFGTLWGSLFFIFLSFASFTTIIAVFESIVAFSIDLGMERKKAVLTHGFAILILSLPCALGFNVLSHIQPLGANTTIQDFLDFIVSSNLLPVGSLLYLMFCTQKYGWGWNNFLQEANTGKGIAFPSTKWMRRYVTVVLSIIVIFIFYQGYAERFSYPLNILLPIGIVIFVLIIPFHAYLTSKK